MEGKDMANFNNQHVINSMQDDQVDDGFFDIKPFISEVFPAFSNCNSNTIPIQIPQTCMNQQVKKLNDTNLSHLYHAAELSQKGPSPFSSSQLISFGKSSPCTSDSDQKFYEDDIVYNRTSPPIRRTTIQAQYHVEAERKRRERLNDLFIALSKVIPGLKKLDKAYVLGDAIKHIKELQERMQTLEEAVKKNSTASPETMIDSFRENSNGTTPEQILDIKIKIEGKNVLIKILCDKKYYGSISSMSSELEKLYLTILDTRILSFGCSTLDITFKAQMDSEVSISIKDITEHLQLGIFQFHS